MLKLSSEPGVGHAAAHHQVAVDVADALPRVDRRQVRRLFGGGEPLRHRKVGSSAHPDFAAAPLLVGQPLDQVVAIATFLPIPQHTVAVGVDHTANIRIADRITLRAPKRRVRTLELLQTRYDPVVQADHAEYSHHAGRCALPLAVRAPCHDNWHFVGSTRAKNVDVDLHTVPQLNGDVLLEHDVHGHGPELRRDLKARLQGSRPRLESGQQASPGGRQPVRRHEYLEFIAHCQLLIPPSGEPGLVHRCERISATT